MPRILGIDPGLNITGYGVLEVSAGPAGVVRGRRRARPHARIAHGPAGRNPRGRRRRDRVAAAGGRWRSNSFIRITSSPRTAILMGHARGVICLAAAQAGIAVVHYRRPQIKKVLTGNGRAPKTQMQAAIRARIGLGRAARAGRRGRRPGRGHLSLSFERPPAHWPAADALRPARQRCTTRRKAKPS